MNHDEIKELAAQFLTSRRIEFVPGGEIAVITETRSEVAFFVPEALDPSAVVDPPDVRVIVEHKSRRCELVTQM
jgi:hypothetical protein